MKKNHVGILELKTTLTEMNNLPEERKSRSELTTERHTVNLKMDQQKVCN